VIPALLALIGRLALHDEVHVFALAQETHAGDWDLAGAHIHNIGLGQTHLRAVRAIARIHRSSPFDVIHAIWSGSCGLIAAVAARMLRRRSLIHVAGGELVSIPDIGYGGSRTWRGRLREAAVLRAVSIVTAASTPVVEALALRGIAAQRVPLGVDLEVWPPREPVRRHGGRSARLLHVASLNRVKDQSTLLHALAALSRSGTSFEMDIVGEDTLDGEVQALAGQLRLLNTVRFHGFLTQRQLRPLVEAADLMVLASRHETGPVVALEAAIAGVPTVGTAVGHIAEWSPDAALAVPVRDPDRLAAAIRQLLEDEDLRLRMAHGALKRAVRESADYTAERFRALYKGLG